MGSLRTSYERNEKAELAHLYISTSLHLHFKKYLLVFPRKPATFLAILFLRLTQKNDDSAK